MCWIALVAVLGVAAPAAAQERALDETPAAKKLVISQDAIARGLAAGHREGVVLQRSRDSLTNGIVIGAVAGFVAGAGFGRLLCAAFEEGNTPCWDGMLRVGAFGAAIGAGAGAGIDALMTRQTPLPIMRVRF